MWAAIVEGVYQAIRWFQSWCGDWGLAIILVTIIFRLLMTPIINKQTKSSYMMQKLQPEMARIKERFPDDQIRQNEEMQKLYASTKFNPLAGCVPMLIQIPIFMALFQALRNIESHAGDGPFKFYNIVPDLIQTPSGMWSQGFGAALPYVLLLVIFAGATFIPMLLQQKTQTDPTQKKTTYIMSAVMSIMMLWIGWSSPAGVLLFWGVSSLIAIAQQQGAMAIMRRKDEQAGTAVIDVTPDINVTRKTKKKRPTKSR
ncbi:MAG: membrane protein insertase YidC [Eggerthellaceae bacterium]|nr:membrane protein insertase YidC [Eggerthellaceae bacterium]